MGYPSKIVTCCYCGARAALVLAKSGRHELACRKCGAPLHDLKMLPLRKRAEVERELIRPSVVRSSTSVKPKAVYKKRKKKSPRPFKFLKDAFEEAFDFVEDIFD